MERAGRDGILWLSGPAGSGKTTLAAGYVENAKTLCLWQQLDEGDRDPSNFFYYLRLAAMKEGIRNAEGLPLLTSEYKENPSLFARRFFERLCCLETRPFAFVFDNYQDAASDGLIHQSLAKGTEAVPPGSRTIILSRNEPPPEYARLMANGKLFQMTFDDLRLSLEESKGIAKLKGRGRLEDRTIARIHAKCEGWAAGLVLLLELSKCHSIEDLLSIEETSCQKIFDYFSGEVFECLDAPMRTLLLRTAFLPKITPEAARGLTGFDNAEEMLATLASSHYFTTRTSGETPIYQYHQLFRGFLLAAAKWKLPEGELHRLRRRAAEYSEKAGNIEDAARLFSETSDWNNVERLVLRHASQLVAQGRRKTVEKWIRAIPDGCRQNEHWLSYWLGDCLMPDTPERGRSLLEHAFHLFKQQEEPAGLFLCWSGIVESVIYGSGKMQSLDIWIEEMDPILKKRPSFPSPEVEAKTVLWFFAALMYRRPDRLQDGYWTEYLREILENVEAPGMKVAIGNQLTMYYLAWRGDHRKALVLLESLRATISAASGIKPVYQIVWRSMEGSCLWFDNKIEESRKFLEDGLAIAEQNGIPIWNFMLLSRMAYTSCYEEETDSAESFLERMRSIQKEGRKLDSAQYYYIRAYLELCKDNLPMALEYADASVRLGKEAGSPTPQQFFGLGRDEVLIELGDCEQAKSNIVAVLSCGLKTGNQYLINHCYRLLSILCFAQGDDQAGHENLRKYLECGQKYNIRNYHWKRASVLAMLMAKALEAGIEMSFARQLIREHRLRPPQEYGIVERWPYPLKISCLGRFSIRIDGRPIDLTKKGQQKPLRLLKALIAFGGRDVGDERLADALWPDADGANAHKSFTTTLYRLRKLVKYDQALVLKGRRLSLNPDYCLVDAACVENVAQEAARQLEGTSEDIDEYKRLAKRIVSIYRGPFMEGEDAAWALRRRESLQGKTGRVLKQVALRLESLRRSDTAAGLFECCLQIDPHSEAVYQCLMRCHRNSGRKAEALAAYRRCRATLGRDLNISPSKETERIYQTILTT